jgi:hypothetical protein
LGHRLEETVARARKRDGLASEGAALAQAWNDVLDVVASLRQEPADKALHNASAFLSAFGHVVVAWLWLDQALAATAAEANLREGRLRACRYFVATELPKARQQLTLVRSLNDQAAEFADACF